MNPSPKTIPELAAEIKAIKAALPEARAMAEAQNRESKLNLARANRERMNPSRGHGRIPDFE
jgi:hypothetical protein